MKQKILKTLIITSLISTLFSQEESSLQEKLFRYKHKLNDQSRIISTVNEKVFFNNKYSHDAEIINRISTKVTKINNDDSAMIEAVFMTSEQNKNSFSKKPYTWGEEYFSIFERDSLGKYKIEDIYFMPVVRDVPVFPEYKIKPGDTWTYQGHEAHDLRRGFNIATPFKVPFTANYKYLYDYTDIQTGKVFNVISVSYDLYFESPKQNLNTNQDLFFPAVTMGHSNQTIWWDNQKGTIDHYKEDFRIIIETFNGDTIKFSGTAKAQVTEFNRVNTEENFDKITQTVKDLGLQNVEILKGEKGLTISIENIQFLPDSAQLMNSEKIKLQKLSAILKEYPNDLLITGHCAKRGTIENQQLISEQRADSVAQYLIHLGIRKSECIFTQGKGAQNPVASNSTEQGRAKNRRVEITLID